MNAGLRKLKETQDEVQKLQKELAARTVVLNEKDVQANQQLELMMQGKAEAEAKKEESLKIAEQVRKSEADIAVRKEKVAKDLSEVEPALLEAKNAVQNIKPADLNEIKVLVKPPDMVKMAYVLFFLEISLVLSFMCLVPFLPVWKL